MITYFAHVEVEVGSGDQQGFVMAEINHAVLVRVSRLFKF